MAQPQLGDLERAARERVEPDGGSPRAARARPVRVRTRFASSAFASRFASARVAATTACSSSRSAVSPAPASASRSAIASCRLRVGDGVRRAARRRSASRPRGAATSAMKRAPVEPGSRAARGAESRGPESEPPPSSAPRRYAPRQHERPTTRFGGCSSGAPDGESTPASRRTAERALVDVDVQLVARRPVERAAAVRADLRAHAEVAQQRERAPRGRRAREVEVHRDRRRRAGARHPTAWKSAESSASRQQRRVGRDRGELVAQVVRERHPSSASSRRL